jgi:hypothetical protein
VQLCGTSDLISSQYGIPVPDEGRRPSVRIASTQLATVLAIESEDRERLLRYDQSCYFLPWVTNHCPVKAPRPETRARMAAFDRANPSVHRVPSRRDHLGLHRDHVLQRSHTYHAVSTVRDGHMRDRRRSRSCESSSPSRTRSDHRR